MWLAPNINSNILYKPSYIRGFKSSPLTKYIDPRAHHCLHMLRILKTFQGCKNGNKTKQHKLANNKSYIHAHLGCRINMHYHNVGVRHNPSNCVQIFPTKLNTKSTGRKGFVPSLILTNTMSLVPKIDEVNYFVVSQKHGLQT